MTDEDLAVNLRKGRVAELLKQSVQSIVSPLGLVPKPSGGFHRIQHLPSPPRHSVNDHIPTIYGQLKYAQFEDALDHLHRAGQGAILVKGDLADAFRHIPIPWPIGGYSVSSGRAISSRSISCHLDCGQLLTSSISLPKP